MSATASCFKDCLRGKVHKGQPTGRIIDVDGTRVYVSEPSGNYSREKGLIFLANVFGLDLKNNRVRKTCSSEQRVSTEGIR